MFKEEAFYANVIEKIEREYGYKLLGKFVAGSDRFQYHVDQKWYTEVRATMLAFTIPGKALAAVFTHMEYNWSATAITEGVAKYESYWAVRFEFATNPDKRTEFNFNFLVYDRHEEFGEEYFDSNFPTTNGWRVCTTCEGYNYGSYNMESSGDVDNNNVVFELLDLVRERTLAAFLADGKLNRINPELWSPVYSFVDCLNVFHKEFSTTADLHSIAEIVDTKPIYNREELNGYKLSNYVGVKASST